MAHEIDTAVEAVEPATLQPESDRAGTDPEGKKLRPGDHAVLPRSEVGDQSVDAATWMHNFAIGTLPTFDAGLFIVAIHKAALDYSNVPDARFCM